MTDRKPAKSSSLWRRILVLASLPFLAASCSRSSRIAAETAEVREETNNASRQFQMLSEEYAAVDRALMWFKARQQDADHPELVSFEAKMVKLKADVAQSTSKRSALEAELDQLKKDVAAYGAKYQPLTKED